MANDNRCCLRVGLDARCVLAAIVVLRGLLLLLLLLPSSTLNCAAAVSASLIRPHDDKLSRSGIVKVDAPQIGARVRRSIAMYTLDNGRLYLSF